MSETHHLSGLEVRGGITHLPAITQADPLGIPPDFLLSVSQPLAPLLWTYILCIVVLANIRCETYGPR